MSNPITNRYEFVILFDVQDGNPNGDPDAGNMPRIDPETGHGIVTDVCVKRKIRNYVETVKNEEPGYMIYVKEGAVLNQQHEYAYKKLELNAKDSKAVKDNLPRLRKEMCMNFYDIRAFGAVMTTGVNCGQVRGPVQLNFARSIDPIFQQEVTITRMAVTTEKDADKKSTEMGRKHVVPYGLYRMEGYVSAKLANDEMKGTGFSEEDINLLWEAIINMFEHDHSAARGKMTVRELIVFKHESELGNTQAYRLFDMVQVRKKDEIETPRSYSDYSITVDETLKPSGVEVIRMI